MIKITKCHLLASLLSTSLLPIGHAHAAGFALIENSASGMGNAYAGAAAIADDPSTIYFNPAGMTQLEGTQFTAATHLIRPSAEFTNQGSTVAGGGTLNGPDSDTTEDAVVPNLFIVVPLSKESRFGLGINTPFGLATQYDENWVGRYHAIKSELITININPSIAWKASDKISLGAGFNIQYLDIELTNAIDFGTLTGLPQQRDGSVKLQGDNLSWGYNLGVLFEPSDDTRIGISYRSMVKQDVKGDADFTVPAAIAAAVTAGGSFVDTNVRALVELPESTSFSIAQQATDNLLVLFDWTWTRWSRFKELRIDYSSVQLDSVTTENWEDSNRFALGLNYKTSNNLVLRTGVALDTTPVSDDQHRTPRIPDNDRRWLSVGLGYKHSTNLSFDFGYTHLFIKDTLSDHTFESSIPAINHNLKGQYESSVDIFSAQLNMIF